MPLIISIALISAIAAIVLFILLRFFSALGRSGSNNGGSSKKIKKRKLGDPDHTHPNGGGKISEGKRGEPHVCPLCAALFEHGENVKSKIFPPTEKPERLLHITGCPYCLNGERERLCPVCGAEVSIDEYLMARVTQQRERPHVHVVGCVHCR